MHEREKKSERKQDYIPTVSIGEQFAGMFFMFTGLSGVVGGLYHLINQEIDLRMSLIMILISLGFGIFGFHLWQDNK